MNSEDIADTPPGIEPCGLYVHVPFCETKCGYCDFYSVALKDRDPSPLVGRILRELALRANRPPHPIGTVFCGGGTPTVLPIEDLDRLLTAVQRVVDNHPVTEWTVEANPATVDKEKVRLLVGHGVTRVSMGAQSFVARELDTLERIHSPDDIAPSVRILRNGGVGRLNLDLIFGIPGQTLVTWRESLARAIDLQPDHIACYGLTYEPGTRLTAMRDHHRIRPCDEHLEADMYLGAIETLETAGFVQYEISNFARPGCRCEHNLIYWRNRDYIGVGPSAAGCVNGRRYKNIADVAGYVRMMDRQGRAEAEVETLDTEKRMTEMIMMQLRLNEGLSIDDFRRRTNNDPAKLLAEPLLRLIGTGLVERDDHYIALTPRGRLLADTVIAELVRALGSTSLSLPVCTR